MSKKKIMPDTVYKWADYNSNDLQELIAESNRIRFYSNGKAMAVDTDGKPFGVIKAATQLCPPFCNNEPV